MEFTGRIRHISRSTPYQGTHRWAPHPAPFVNVTAILHNHYVLAVHHAAATARFFVTEMGFEEVFEGGGWHFVKRDGCLIMIGECPDAVPPRDLGDHQYFGYLVVDDADAYYRELTERDVDIIAPIESKPWGMREFCLRTPDGHRMMVGQDIEPETGA